MKATTAPVQSDPTYTKPGGYAPVPLEDDGFGNVQGAEVKFTEAPKFKDIPFAVAFVVQFLVVVGILIAGLSTHVDCEKFEGIIWDCKTVSGDFSELLPFIKLISLLGSLAVVLSVVYVFLLRVFTKPMVYVGIGFTILSEVGAAVYFGMHQQIYAAVIFGILALFMVIYFVVVRHRIDFAILVLKTASEVIASYPATHFMAIGSIFFKVAFACFWSYTLIMAQRFGANASYALTSFMIFSFYWHFEVVKNLVHVSVSGTVATWYFLSDRMPENPTLDSFKRASTYSFGSIAFGSLIVAVIKTLRVLVRMASSRRNAILMIITRICLSCLDWIAQYFNHYAFVQVAVYGKSYIEAAKATWNLMQHSGLSALVNDNILDGVLWMGVFLSAIICGASGYLVVMLDFLGISAAVSPWIGVLVGALSGFLVMILSMQVIDSSIATIFVCFAENKPALQQSKPELYQSLMETYYNIPSV